MPRRKKENNDSKETSALSMLISAVFIAAIAYFGYQQLQRFRLENAEPIEAQQLTQPAIQKSLPDTRSNYSCDGRTYCSQMSSCEEAKYFINHCPNTKMDGNHDGIPCQEQHCTSSW
ncbi:MAG: excalibur calcium-binding domain-containing protein [Candidatus Saccharibacteria bacterium]|nr:excalibur calcium-binding domain-containing protein [Moraxellaceae bacterium]